MVEIKCIIVFTVYMLKGMIVFIINLITECTLYINLLHVHVYKSHCLLYMVINDALCFYDIESKLLMILR